MFFTDFTLFFPIEIYEPLFLWSGIEFNEFYLDLSNWLIYFDAFIEFSAPISLFNLLCYGDFEILRLVAYFFGSIACGDAWEQPIILIIILFALS
jgi:hypothetical protein